MVNLVLKPRQAWEAADAVYQAKFGVKPVQKAFSDDTSLGEIFDFAGLDHFSSKTGAFIKVKSGFGIVAKGCGTNSGEVLVAMRGTDLKPDWLTDANLGIQITRTGKTVHAGFNRVFNEFEPYLKSALKKCNPATVHCVGHSLGGALANLTADMVRANGMGEAKLYTFGAPRVGFKPFAANVTEKTGAKNVYRVHHDNDFVSLVPLWPFVHAPQPGDTCCIRNHGFGTFGAHKMANYETSLMGYADNWESLRMAEPPLGAVSKEIEDWLSKDTVSAMSTFTLGMIGKAVQYILKVAGVSLQMGLIVGFTALDQLSYLLEHAWKASKTAASWVEYLIKKILRIVGHTLNVALNISVAFIRWVFQLLASAAGRLVNMALLGSR